MQRSIYNFICMSYPTFTHSGQPCNHFFLNDFWQIGTDNRVSLNVNSSESLSGGGLFIGKTRKLPWGAEPAFLSAPIKPVTRLLFSQNRFCLIKNVQRRGVFLACCHRPSRQRSDWERVPAQGALLKPTGGGRLTAAPCRLLNDCGRLHVFFMSFSLFAGAWAGPSRRES